MWERVRSVIYEYLRKDYFVGKYTYGRPNVIRYGTKESAYVGKFCSIGRNVTFLLTGNHRLDSVSTYPFPVFHTKWRRTKGIKSYYVSKGNIVIGNDVWIGYGAFILSGITVGDGAVIGAYAVVSKDVPPYTIVAGNPAKIVKKRFSDKNISKLLKLKWWDWPEDKIKRFADLLCGHIGNIEQLENENKK